jgi:hypothetical protein
MRIPRDFVFGRAPRGEGIYLLGRERTFDCPGCGVSVTTRSVQKSHCDKCQALRNKEAARRAAKKQTAAKKKARAERNVR